MPGRFCPLKVIFTDPFWVPHFGEPNGKGHQASPIQQRECEA